MATAAPAVRRSRSRASLATTVLRWVDLPAFSAWLLPAAAVLLLAFNEGGYDQVFRGEVGIAVWWLVGVGALTGAVRVRGGALGWVALGLLASFCAWTVLALLWTDSTERTVIEIARVTTYVGVLVVALATQGRAAARHAVNGAACAIVVVAGAALLSRLHPQWFSEPVAYDVFPQSRPRLLYPLGYFNLLAGLLVMGVPALLAGATQARTVSGRALALAAIPIVGLAVYLTVSRGAVLSITLAPLAFLLLAPNRLPKVAAALVAGAGTALLCGAADARNALQENLGNAAHLRQGDELLVIVLLAVVGVGSIGAAIALADRHATRPRWSVPSPRVTSAGFALVACVVVAGFFAAGGSSWAQHRWDDFRGTGTVDTGAARGDVVARLSSITSNGRLQYWEAAERAQSTRPLLGRGPGTFEYVWARDGTAAGGGFVRDAHSLWFQTLAETGLVGVLLIGAFVLLALGAGAVRALRARDLEQRTAIAAAVGGIVAFAVTASFEWAWQMTVLPVLLFVFVAVALTGVADPGLSRAPRVEAAPAVARSTWIWRGVAAAIAVAAVVAIAIPTAGAGSVRASQEQAGKGDLVGALRDAVQARTVQPYSATALMQAALVQQARDDRPPALADARAATRAEPTNWRTWLIRARLEAQAGRVDAAIASYRNARSLNPRSVIFAR